MNFLELIILAIGLSMDAFAVAIGKGLSMKKVILKRLSSLAYTSVDFRLVCLLSVIF